ncbi:hypothetical protein NDU88_001975 [Pleurodeles waltl]|uniref:Uncharacterized protein n=1 Tax=Pleurodeles waltl TaxID=8319 RepID=A0AAV7TJB8_PLEWA|nr:hypothetical protein NDU88_001975 [Pleurodeles waltl]
MRSVASTERGSAGIAVVLEGVFGDAMSLGSARASENCNRQECLPVDLPVGITAQKGGFCRTPELHRADERMMWQCGY